MGNVKIHFASAEQATWVPACLLSGVKYGLLTAYPFVTKRLGLSRPPYFYKKVCPDQQCLINLLHRVCTHTILDSGLFTLMFGAKAGKKNSETITAWFNTLCDFIGEAVPTGVSCVEVDCQKVLCPEMAWYYRKRMRSLLPKHDIINVWHLEDGYSGLDRLLDFSSYIAFSIPELRNAIVPGVLSEYALALCEHSVKRSPHVRIHLLGCTQQDILLKCNHLIYSCDSTSWTPRSGIFLNAELNESLRDGILSILPNEFDAANAGEGFLRTCLRWGLSMQHHKAKYTQLYGDQN